MCHAIHCRLLIQPPLLPVFYQLLNSHLAASFPNIFFSPSLIISLSFCVIIFHILSIFLFISCFAFSFICVFLFLPYFSLCWLGPWVCVGNPDAHVKAADSYSLSVSRWKHGERGREILGLAPVSFCPATMASYFTEKINNFNKHQWARAWCSVGWPGVCVCVYCTHMLGSLLVCLCVLKLVSYNMWAVLVVQKEADRKCATKKLTGWWIATETEDFQGGMCQPPF